MVTMWILMGLGVMILVPLVSVFLVLVGLGGLINTAAKSGRGEIDDD